MADISAIGFAPEAPTYKGLLGNEQRFASAPTMKEENSFEDSVEPLLRVQEHLKSQEEGCGTVNPAALSADSDMKPTSYDDFYDTQEQKLASRNAGHADEAMYARTKLNAGPLYLGDASIDFSSGAFSNNGYGEAQAPFLDDGGVPTFAKGLCSDPPYDLGYCEAPGVAYEQSAAAQKISPGVGSNLGLSNDEPALGSTTESVQSPEFPPYEYKKEDSASELGNYGLGAPRILPASFNAQEYDESRFPAFNGMHNGYYSDADFPGTLMSHAGKTPELNTWQNAALTAAYADATKAAAVRALIEASYYPHSPDLYDKAGRSLTGGGNLDYHPVYGVYRNMPSSESPSSLRNTPNLSMLLNSPTFDPPVREASMSAPRSRAGSSKKVAAPDFETKLLPRPSFAASSVSGGSFMMVNLRMKKGAHKKKGRSNSSSNGSGSGANGVGKRGPSNARPKPLYEQTGTWNLKTPEN